VHIRLERLYEVMFHCSRWSWNWLWVWSWKWWWWSDWRWWAKV